VYALLRKAKQAEPPGVAEEAALRVREGALPILKAQPGFLLHLGFRSEACEVIEASLFDDQRRHRKPQSICVPGPRQTRLMTPCWASRRSAAEQCCTTVPWH
jgi:hypothetical protein